jgi:hypothetical protein
MGSEARDSRADRFAELELVMSMCKTNKELRSYITNTVEYQAMCLANHDLREETHWAWLNNDARKFLADQFHRNVKWLQNWQRISFRMNPQLLTMPLAQLRVEEMAIIRDLLCASHFAEVRKEVMFLDTMPVYTATNPHF